MTWVNNMDKEISTKINTVEDARQERLLEEKIKRIVAEYLKSSAFTGRKLTDTPTDSNQVVPRGYVTMNGTVANRPKSSVATIGQPYYATDLAIPLTYSSAGWRNGVGSVIALNN